MIWQVTMVMLGISPVAIMFALLTWKNRRLDADERREAITTELRNLPAASVQKQRDDLVERQVERLYSAVVIGLVTALTIVSRRATADFSNWNWLDTLLLLVVLGSGIYYGRQMIGEMPHGRRLRKAIRAEQATAQELAASLAGDNRLIHDVQAGEFNIDHVVVTPAGVFAVETKSRLKPPAGNGPPKVRYDGKALDFGAWKETKPVVQAERQARWLAKYLREATGETFPVTPVLALPGWYVERAAPITSNMVQVINPKNSGWLLLPEKKLPRLEPKAIQRAAFALEKLAQARAE